MGKHSLPKEYLRQFGDPSDPDKIWMYFKSSRKCRLLPIETVAQAPNFYTDEDEPALNVTVEVPAQFAMKELRLGRGIDDKSRSAMSKYIVSMIFRVPAMRAKLAEDAHRLLPDMARVAKQHAESIAHAWDESTESVLRLADHWEAKARGEPPSKKDDAVRRQFVPESLVDTVNSMTWTVIAAPKSESFVLGDNPLFAPEGTRMEPPYGEFSIPLSTQVALHGSWRGGNGRLYFVNGSPRLVKEINRRSVASAQSFIFCHLRVSWLERLLNSNALELHRIKWTSTSGFELLSPPPSVPREWSNESLLEDLKSPPMDELNYLTNVPS